MKGNDVLTISNFLCRYAVVATVMIGVIVLSIDAKAADFYVKGGVMASNTSFDTANVGGTVSFGLGGDLLAGEIEASNHRHLGNSVAGLGANVYVYPLSLGPVDLYGKVGVGASNRDVLRLVKEYGDQEEPFVDYVKQNTTPYGQAMIGAEVGLTDSLSLYGEGGVRTYYEGWGDILQFDMAGVDTVIVAGAKFKF